VPGAVRHFSDLVCWQLADELRVIVLTLTERGTFANDRKLRAQIEDAMDSVCRNTAEGFGCESHAEFARFVEIARRSLNEVQDCLRSAQIKRYLTEPDLTPIHRLLKRLYSAQGRLIAYLRRTPNRRESHKGTVRRTEKT
jgi:four helix bundle protein